MNNDDLKSIFNKPINEMMKENLSKAPFRPEVPESSGLSDELSDEDIKSVMNYQNKDKEA